RCFFSSRRRHTRSKRDWSSDVCSSDLLLQRVQKGVMPYFECGKCPAPWILRKSGWRSVFSEFPDTGLVVLAIGPAQQFFRAPDRSEERRVGKERASAGVQNAYDDAGAR